MAASNLDCSNPRNQKVSGTYRLKRASLPGYEDTTEINISNLLLDAGIINREQLDSALTVAAEYNQPVSKILNVTQNVAQISIDSAKQAQLMIEDLEIEREAALKALRTSHSAGLPFDYVAARTECQSRNCEDLSDLEHLLVRSDIATIAGITEARSWGEQTELPIGTALFALALVPFGTMNSAFECLYFINNGWLTTADAIAVLSHIRNNNIDLKTALNRQGFASTTILPHIKLGDLLLQTKLIDEPNLLTKLAESISTKRLLGSLLLESGLIDEDHLIDVLIVQNFCSKDLIDAPTAVKLIRKSLESNRELASIAEHYNVFRDDPLTAGGARELLLVAGLVSADEIDQALARYYTYGMDCLCAVVAAGFVTPTARSTAIECSYLVLRNLLTVNESVLVLQKCNGPDFGLHEEFHLLPDARRQEHAHALQQSITDGFQSNTESFRPRLFKSLEFLMLMAMAAFAAWGVAMSVLSTKFNTNGYSYVVVALLTIIAAIQVGLRWRRRLNTARFENELKVENAKDTIKRLSNSKRKLA
jgi:hypothetical protein